MKRIILLSILLGLSGLVFACSTDQPQTGDSPTEAYKRLFAAVKARDIEAIKKNVTQKTVDLGLMSARRYGTSPEKMYENGFTGTTFSESLPAIRDERIKGSMGAIEVWNSKESKWEDLPFILDNGTWKLAMGELFSGTYQLPEKGRDQKEKEAANAANPVPVRTLVNGDPAALVNSNSISAPPSGGANK
ncbi:MAG: hypothetical protein AB7J13_01670 [Pyrinomonadaceae bacterium]